MEHEVARLQLAAVIRRGAESDTVADEAVILDAKHASAQTVNGRCATKRATLPSRYRLGVCAADMPARMAAWKLA